MWYLWHLSLLSATCTPDPSTNQYHNYFLLSPTATSDIISQFEQRMVNFLSTRLAKNKYINKTNQVADLVDGQTITQADWSSLVTDVPTCDYCPLAPNIWNINGYCPVVWKDNITDSSFAHGLDCATKNLSYTKPTPYNSNPMLKGFETGENCEGMCFAPYGVQTNLFVQFRSTQFKTLSDFISTADKCPSSQLSPPSPPPPSPPAPSPTPSLPDVCKPFPSYDWMVWEGQRAVNDTAGDCPCGFCGVAIAAYDLCCSSSNSTFKCPPTPPTENDGNCTTPVSKPSNVYVFIDYTGTELSQQTTNCLKASASLLQSATIDCDDLSFFTNAGSSLLSSSQFSETVTGNGLAVNTDVVAGMTSASGSYVASKLGISEDDAAIFTFSFSDMPSAQECSPSSVVTDGTASKTGVILYGGDSDVSSYLSVITSSDILVTNHLCYVVDIHHSALAFLPKSDNVKASNVIAVYNHVKDTFSAGGGWKTVMMDGLTHTRR